MKDLMKYVNQWYLFVIALALSLTLAYFYLHTATPEYKISSTLLIQEDKKGDGMLKGTAFSDLEMFRTTKTVDNEIEIIRSKDLIFKVLKDLRMQVSYLVEKPLKTTELYGKSLPFRVAVFELRRGAYQKKISIKTLSSTSFILDVNGLKKTCRFNEVIRNPLFVISVVKGPAFRAEMQPVTIRFNNLKSLTEGYHSAALSVTPVMKDANTIIVSLVDAIPQRGIDFLEKLIEKYNQRDVQNKNTIARNTIRFIDNRLKYLVTDLSQVERDVENYKQRNRVTNIAADAELNLQNSGTYEQQLSSAEVQLNLVQTLENYLNESSGRFDLVPTTLGLKDVTLMSLTGRYNELLLQRQQLLQGANDRNPLVENITQQLANLRANMRENLRNIKRGLVLERNNLLTQSYGLDSRLRSVPAIERGLLERTREQEVKQTLYHYLLQKREETALTISATVPTSQIIDRPQFNSNPENPKPPLIYLCSFLAGLLVPVSFIYCKDKLDSRVKNVDDVELLTGARILGELPHKPKKEALVIERGSRTTISELFRYIRQNLRFMSSENQVLLVTSTVKGEGKTFFTVNLGATLALADKKVVLLEFDLRKPDLLNTLNLQQKKGISDYLDSRVHDVDQIIQPSVISPNLSVIGCGSIPDNPSELLLDSRMEELFTKLRQKFDYIVIDTSPVGQVSDAYSLAAFADASIYLVRYNFTNKFQLRILQDIYENKRFNNPMVVFNDAKENKNSYGYGKYSYA